MVHGYNVAKNEGGKIVFIQRVDCNPETGSATERTESTEKIQQRFSASGMAHKLRRGLQDIRVASQSSVTSVISVISVACFCFQGVVTRRLTGMRPPCESITYIFTLGRIFSIASR